MELFQTVRRLAEWFFGGPPVEGELPQFGRPANVEGEGTVARRKCHGGKAHGGGALAHAFPTEERMTQAQSGHAGPSHPVEMMDG